MLTSSKGIQIVHADHPYAKTGSARPPYFTTADTRAFSLETWHKISAHPTPI